MKAATVAANKPVYFTDINIPSQALENSTHEGQDTSRAALPTLRTRYILTLRCFEICIPDKVLRFLVLDLLSCGHAVRWECERRR